MCDDKLLIGFMYVQNIPVGSIDTNSLPASLEHIPHVVHALNFKCPLAYGCYGWCDVDILGYNSLICHCLPCV
jgi:hypothetical protein